MGRQSAAILITQGGAPRRTSRRADLYSRADAEPSRPSPALRAAVRAGAAGALAAAVAVPLLRRRARIPAPVTIAACAGGPARRSPCCARARASATSPCSRCRCGPSRWSTSFPTTTPSGCARRLRIRYPIVVDRVDRRSAGCPTSRLQRGLARLPRVGTLDRFLTWVHWLWFLEPYVALVFILLRHPERFPRAARRLAAVFDIGCVVYFAVPTAPPWWASEQGLTGEEVRRIMVEVGEETWGSAWPGMYDALGGNPWAAMPSLHFATSLVGGDLAGRDGHGRRARVGWAYALTLGFALVYLGEHYVTDLAAGGGAGRRRARAASRSPSRSCSAVNRRLQRLERLANG